MPNISSEQRQGYRCCSDQRIGKPQGAAVEMLLHVQHRASADEAIDCVYGAASTLVGSGMEFRYVVLTLAIGSTCQISYSVIFSVNRGDAFHLKVRQ